MWHTNPSEVFFFSSFLGALAKLRKATINFAMSVCPSCGMEQLGSHWTDFLEIWYMFIFRKSVKKIQVSSKCDNDGHFTFMIVSPSFLRKMKNVSDKSCRENTHFMYNIYFPKILRFMRQREKM
jgi:hypothetical protein